MPGKLLKKPASEYFRWTPDKVCQLEILLGEGLPSAKIAELLGAPDIACIQYASGRYGIVTNLQDYRLEHTTHKVAQKLGIADERVVRKWHKSGMLECHKNKSIHALVFISDSQLLTFLGDRRYFHLYDPKLITDRALREWNLEERVGKPPSLSTKEIADYFHVSRITSTSWCAAGLLPSYRLPKRNTYRAWPEDIEKFKPPYLKPFLGRSGGVYTPFEDALIDYLRSYKYFTSTEISKVFNNTRIDHCIMYRYNLMHKKGLLTDYISPSDLKDKRADVVVYPSNQKRHLKKWQEDYEFLLMWSVMKNHYGF